MKNYNGEDYKSSDPRAAAQVLNADGTMTDAHSGRTIRIDTHSDIVCDDVWAMYKHLIQKTGAVATLIEWDMDIPSLDILVNEAHKATAIMKRIAEARVNVA
ncbi:MAG: hypothetical protein ACI8QY_001167 [bacterium]